MVRITGGAMDGGLTGGGERRNFLRRNKACSIDRCQQADFLHGCL